MVLTQCLRIPVEERTDLAEVRRQAAQVARSLRFSEEREGRVSILATELAGNLFKHAGGGEVLLRVLAEEPSPGLELLGLDRGPGMADVGGCLRDGFSTAASPGTGFGAMRRLSDLFDLYTLPGKGTAVLLRLHREAPPSRQELFRVGAVCLPLEGESVGGDGWCFFSEGSRGRLVVVDGLGHGPLAAQAAESVLRVFQATPFLELETLLRRFHEACRHGRGAACSVGEVDLGTGKIRLSGVGNVSGMLATPAGVHLWMPHAGTLGAQAVRAGQVEFPWSPGTTLVLFSDGLGSRCKLEAYPGLLLKHPALCAGVLYRDCARGTDDVTVAAVRALSEEDGPWSP